MFRYGPKRIFFLKLLFKARNCRKQYIKMLKYSWEITKNDLLELWNQLKYSISNQAGIDEEKRIEEARRYLINRKTTISDDPPPSRNFWSDMAVFVAPIDEVGPHDNVI